MGLMMVVIMMRRTTMLRSVVRLLMMVMMLVIMMMMVMNAIPQPEELRCNTRVEAGFSQARPSFSDKPVQLFGAVIKSSSIRQGFSVHLGESNPFTVVIAAARCNCGLSDLLGSHFGPATRMNQSPELSIALQRITSLQQKRALARGGMRGPDQKFRLCPRSMDAA